MRARTKVVNDKIVVKELGPKLADDYLSFFDTIYSADPWLNTRDNPWWGICYCGIYDDPRSEQERNTAPDAATKNRAMRANIIQSGKAHGLLAYLDGKVVGWCNAGPKSSYQDLGHLDADESSSENIGSILCFVVESSSRRKGIATSLLNAVCDKFHRDGLMVAEGYPRTLPPNVNNPHNTPPEHQNYRGSLGMFLKAGFKLHQQLERHAVVRRDLRI